MCLCVYHANFIAAVNSLNCFVPVIPTYENNFIRQFLCEVQTSECWLSNCNHCNGISQERLNKSIGNTDLTIPVNWELWEKNSESKRIEKHKKNGTLIDLLNYIVNLSPQFLRHSFVKREQSDVFNKIDRVRVKGDKFINESLIQVDFAENFICEAQDEVQSAHWNQRQLTLFTSATFYQNQIFSKVFVSNNLNHTKETIVPYLYKLITELPPAIKIVKIWSDGPSSQFKNKYVAAIISKFEIKFDKKIYWNYFATSHGKGCVDGIGATAKNIVRKQVLARKYHINNATDFVNAFKLTASDIKVTEMTEEDFNNISQELNLSETFKSAKNIKNISSSHHLQVQNNVTVSFLTSKLGYQNVNLI